MIRAYDVVICGGGLAGLALARQLRLELPSASVVVIDRLSRPLPEAAHKVGESSIELGTYYFGQVLKLDRYFRTRHLPKLGLRFFFGDTHGPFEDRPEVGPSVFPPVPSYQIDRGRLENDLREIVAGMGVDILEGTRVDDVELSTDGGLHTVKCSRPELGSASFSVSGRWLVDALGWRRFLQTKLGLKMENGHGASSAWWRIDTRVDVEDLAPNAMEWRRRIIEDRYYSTNHLMGRGYWVWFIPLGSGATSLGIVTDESIHPQRTYGTSYDQALEWLKKHEPRVWELMQRYTPIDFLTMRNYSHHSRQIYSHNRWSCVGPAGIFLDPLYSVGSDFIAIGNTITVEMIRRDLKGELTEAAVDEYNRLVLDVLAPICCDYYRGVYRSFGHGQIFAAKLAWDTSLYWAYMYQVYVQGLLVRPSAEVFALGHRYRELNARVQQLFAEWSDSGPPRAPFVLPDLTRMPWLQYLHIDLSARRTEEQFLQTARTNLDRFEELAQVLFWQAVEECFPEHTPKDREHPPWINVLRMRLHPSHWDEAMRTAVTPPRRLRSVMYNFAGIFRPMNWREWLRVQVPYRVNHCFRGRLFAYHIIPYLQRKLVKGRPALWVRRIFVADYPVAPRATVSSATEHAGPA